MEYNFVCARSQTRYYLIGMKTIKCRYRNQRMYVEILGVETEIGIGDLLLPGVAGLSVAMHVTGYQVFGVAAVAILNPLN